MDIFGYLKSWILWRSEPANLSRSFWMPDNSCLVCYDCDARFTLFNRKHHCRNCGRVFCNKCSLNWVPEKIRVCNFCFKQWEQRLPDNENNGSTSSSTKSAATAESMCSPFASIVNSEDQSSFVSQSTEMDKDANRVGLASPERSKGFVADKGKLSPPEDGSDDEEDGGDQFDRQTSDYCEDDLYYNHNEFYGNDTGYKIGDVLRDVVNCDGKNVSSYSVQNSCDSERFNQLGKKENDTGFESDAHSSTAPAEEDVEPVDFENNGLLWIPPEPEDDENENDATDAYDDDEVSNTREEWGNYCSLNSLGSGEHRVKYRSNEENKNAVKNVVDGHFRSLIAQLLLVENIPLGEEEDQQGWLNIITSLSWEAATLLKPDMSIGGGMDPGGYVKVKCIASGYPSQSMMVKGVVCKKNVAHRRMTSKMEKPRLMILGGALEYQRVSNHLSSFDTLLQQEMDHLKMAVAKINVHQPDVLLVEKSVSRYAQDYLLERDISLVLNIKRPLLERIARCTGAQIVPSVDHLLSPKLGYCDFFHVKRFTEEHGTAGQRGRKSIKTLMYFEGCPKPLGYTILLKGASIDELKKVKHVVQYGVFAAYHLALETSFLADEGASLPELPFNSPITVALPEKPLGIFRSISTVPDITIPACEKTQDPQPFVEPQRSKSVPIRDLVSFIPTLSSYHAFVHKCKSACKDSLDEITNATYGAQDFIDKGCNPSDNTDTMCADQVAVSEPEINSQNELEPTALKEDFPPSPSDHQSILVSLSARCVWKGTVCERSHLFRIKYYGNFDKPLGRFLRNHLFDQGYQCRSCDMPAEAHVQCYTHRQGTLTISVKRLPEFLLPGEIEGKIWMWHRCLRCPKVNGFPPATRRIVMSDAAWGLSFGKFLELSFSNHAAASRVASCGHSLHRDCLRFYGLGKMVACFRYASIDILSVYLPPLKLDFNYDSQDWIQHEMNEVVGRAELLFAEVLNAISQMDKKISGSQPLETGAKVSRLRQQLADLEAMLQKEKAEFEESLQKILKKGGKKDHPIIDIFEINRLRRQLLFQSYIWDQHLICAARLETDVQGDLTDLRLVQMDKPSPHANLIEMNDPVNPSKLETVSVKAEHDDGRNDGQKIDVDGNQLKIIYQKNCLQIDPEHSKEGLVKHSSAKTNNMEFEQTETNTLPEVQFSVIASLSDTLEAAWTGGSQSVVAAPKAELCALSESTVKEPSTEVVDVEKLRFEEHGNDKKGTAHTEDSGRWLGKPFLSFYRSLNKNILGGTQKLDMFGYDPVYVSSFRELELRGGARLLLPVGVNDTVIPIYDDEATSIISYALVSSDYVSQLSEHEKVKDMGESAVPLKSMDSLTFQSLYSYDEMVLESFRSLGSLDDSMSSISGSRTSMGFDPASNLNTLHAKVSFSDNGPLGKVKYTVTCYFAKEFEALRRICCPSEMDFVRSLSRCKKWGAQGGKSNVFFAKTLDDRFIIKQVTKTELDSFTKFAPSYFKYLSESIRTQSPTCLAKVLGIYQVTSKHLKGGKEWKMDVLVIENLLFGRKLTRLYDLKGSSRSRYNSDSSGKNKVLLDQNLIEAMPTCPIFVGNKAKRLLERAVWNDTSFLASIDVMDYSLLVGVDEEKHELVLGIIDFMRQYTWDKHLETWVKTSGILGGPKNVSPTVISPKQYKKRFRKAMTTYFLMVPDQWSPPTVTPSKSQSATCEENNRDGTLVQ